MSKPYTPFNSIQSIKHLSNLTQYPPKPKATKNGFLLPF
nr:MAG TPA: hypothetical protein [Caudoviricetes sp.]